MKVLNENQGHGITHLREKFPEGADDPVWIFALGVEEGWIIVSGDPQITRGRAEREAWRESKLTAFFLGSGWASRKYWVQIEELVRWWPKIIEQAQKAEKGTGFILPFKAKEMKVIYSPA